MNQPTQSEPLIQFSRWMNRWTEADRIAHQLARRQCGVLSTEQLMDSGHSKESIRSRVASGHLERLHPGVLGIAGAPDTWMRRATAAYLWAQPGGVISHRSAAVIHGLDGVEQGPIEVTLSSGRKRPDIVCHRVPHDEMPRARKLRGVEVTWVERTFLDLGGVLKPRKVGLALDDALRKSKTTIERLWTEAETVGGKGRDGTATLKELLGLRDDRDGTLESRLETAALHLLRSKILPPVTTQHRIFEAGAYIARLDFAFPFCKLGVEAHSYRWHAGQLQWKRDIARDNRLKLLGWTVLHYTWDDIHFERGRVLAEISQMIRSLSLSLPI